MSSGIPPAKGGNLRLTNQRFRQAGEGSICHMEKTTKNTKYWDEVAKTWQYTIRQRVLRSISDMLNNRLLDRWLPKRRVDCLLKTDLFDESLTEGASSLLATRAKKAVGIDNSVAVLNSAKRNNHNKLHMTAADVRHLPFATGTFDIIVSNSTLDHFERSEDIIFSLKELNRVLRQNGQLLITLDNPLNPFVALRSVFPFSLLNHLGIVPYYVGATLGAHRLRRTLEELGFSVMEVTTLWHFPRIIVADLANIVDKLLSGKLTPKFLKVILAFEYLSKLPTKYFTGHFVAARGIKRS